MNNSAKAWSLRGVQLDLARQMETVEYICGFTNFIAEHGFNTLVLYLEGRIRTPSFPYPKPEESYSREEMKAVVRHAAKRGIDVVPVVSNLGHADQFLRHPELAHLAELRDGRPGRVTSMKLDVCPSLKETYQFFEAYFTEVSELFPSLWFHIGNDEAYDIGYCDLCRPRAEGKEGQTGIFAKHLIDTHAIVTGKLGKRMIVWDDLFEHYWGALEQIPRDIVLCCWQYDGNIRQPVAHFENRKRRDLLADYRRLGFESLVAPRELNWRNTVSLTRYAIPQAPLGGLVTVWELAADFLHARYPNIAFAGRLWSEPERIDDLQTIRAEVADKLLPGMDEAALAAVWGAQGLGQFTVGASVPAFLRESPAGRRTERRLTNQLLTATLAKHAENPIIEDLLVDLGKERLQLELSELVPQAYGMAARGQSPASLTEPLRQCAAEAGRLHEARQRQWRKYRSGVLSTDNRLDTYWTSFRQSLEDFADAVAEGKLDRTGLLTVEYFLPDLFSCQWVSLAVQFTDGEDWQEIVTGDVPKPLFFWGDDEYEHSGYLRVSYPIAGGRTISRCRIDSWGYGGIGLRHMEFRAPGVTCLPQAIVAAAGMVTQPQHVLDNSSSWCWLGEPDTGLAFQNPGLARARHSLTLALAEIA